MSEGREVPMFCSGSRFVCPTGSESELLCFSLESYPLVSMVALLWDDLSLLRSELRVSIFASAHSSSVDFSRFSIPSSYFARPAVPLVRALFCDLPSTGSLKSKA